MKRSESDAIATEVVDFLHVEKELTYRDARKVASRVWHLLSKEIEKNVKKAAD